jgi:tetratricopeptide (TPR) repeat protein
LLAVLRELAGVRTTLTIDRDGRLRSMSDSAGPSPRAGSHAVAAVVGISEAGRVAGLSDLSQVVVRARAAATVTAVWGGELFQVTLDPAQPTTEVERALVGWSGMEGAEGATAPREAPQSPEAQESVADLWAALRRALVRERMADAAALRARLGTAGLEASDEQALEVLLDGISSIVAGDALGGARALRPLATADRSVLIRWVALHWSSRAALRCNALQAARWYAKEGYLAAKNLDAEAQGASQVAAGEVVSQDGDLERALAWFRTARATYEASEDGWGQARTWLAEARALERAGQGGEATAAARRAMAVDPAWDEPALFLARAALEGGAIEVAEQSLLLLSSQSADRARALFASVRQGVVSAADAAEIMRQDAAPPSPAGLAALDRIARASAQLPLAQDALAWMFLRAGRYADAAALFRRLLGGTLVPSVRSSVMRGLGCVAHALQTDGQVSGEEVAQEAATAPAAAGASSVAEAVSRAAAPSADQAARSVLGAGAGFSGQLGVFALPDLLEFLRGARRTGVLVCSSGAGVGSLRFQEGFLAGGAAPSVPRLGELLVAAGQLSAAALEAVVRAPSQDDRALGVRLVAAAMVDGAAIEAALREQIKRAVRVLVHWREGEFAFNHDAERPESDGLDVQVDAQAVLLDVFKDLDEDARDRRAP